MDISSNDIMGYIFNNGQRKKINLQPFALLQILIFVGLLFLIPFYFYELYNNKYLYISVPVILTISYVVLFAGIGAYVLWIGAIQLIGRVCQSIFALNACFQFLDGNIFIR